MTNEKKTIIEFKGISKRFYNTQALDDISFDIKKGEILAIVGENGAGKSTLLNILLGTFQPDKGNIFYNGNIVEIKSPTDAKKIGFSEVHQELQLIPRLDVGQNIFLGKEPKYRFIKIINWKELYKRTSDILELLEADFTGKDIINSLSAAQKQITEIAKALLEESVVLALDEPTSSLSMIETKKLFEIIKSLKRSGTTIIYVSHRLDEVFEIADRVVVLRDGKLISVYPIDEMNKESLIKLMIGRDIKDTMRSTVKRSIGEVVLKVDNIVTEFGGDKASFVLHKGEILGFAGLVGAGRTELMGTIFGAYKKKEGRVVIGNKEVKINNTTDAVKNGIALVPEDRKNQGFVSILTNRSNINLASLDEVIKGGFLNYDKMTKKASEVIEALRVVPPEINKQTRELSGGNQQKIVLGKWLSSKFKIIIFDEPTRGIDVGAKAEIYNLIYKLAAEGCSIIMISSELIELLGMCDRIIVMHRGKIMGELMQNEASEEKILKMAMNQK